MTPKANRMLEQAYTCAAEQLKGQMSIIDQESLHNVAGCECYAWPAHTYLYRVDDSCDLRRIQDMLKSMGPDIAETLDDAKAWADDHGIDWGEVLAEATEGLCQEEAEDQADDILATTIDLLGESWQEQGDELCDLHSYGWQDVGDTGLLAIELDGETYLGIHGGGYNFMDAHWLPLYKAMGYSWHVHSLRKEVVDAAVGVLMSAGGARQEEALSLLRACWRRYREGGDISADEMQTIEQVASWK